MNTLPSLVQLINLKGKTAIVTGGAMGIGLGIARRLAEAGANIVIADFNNEAGLSAVKELKDAGAKAEFIKTDVSSEQDVKSATDFAVKTFGGIDILVNNAGIYPNIPMLKITPEEFDKIISVNLRGLFMFTKKTAEIMITQGHGGKIINITSVDALHPSMVGLATYDASKHGAWGFTKNVALELAPHKIWVNCIAPGGISTPGVDSLQSKSPISDAPDMKKMLDSFLSHIPMHRMGEPDEIGKVALFLASDLSSYMTGSQVVVDGGVLLS